MEMIVFVGGPGAGKSTFYQSRFRDTHVRINLDMLRTRHRENGLIDACLAFKQRLVIDNTNPTAADRAKYIAKARAARFTIACYFFDTPLEDMLVRNASRTGKARVPDAAILATRRKLDIPRHSEGFDAVYRVAVWETQIFEISELIDEI